MQAVKYGVDYRMPAVFLVSLNESTQLAIIRKRAREAAWIVPEINLLCTSNLK